MEVRRVTKNRNDERSICVARQMKTSFIGLLTFLLVMGLLPPTALALSPAYEINGSGSPWQDATLAADGDTLIITTADSPLAPVRIHATAPEGSTVTIKGQAGTTYANVYLEIDEAITLNLENLKISAPAGDSFNGLSFTKQNSPKSITVNVTGDNLIEGFNGISSISNHQLTIAGSGTLVANGRASTTATTDSGHGIYVQSDGTGVTTPGAKLTLDGSVTLKVYGGDAVAGSGGSGIFLDWGNMLVKGGTLEATGGKTNGDRTGQSTGSGVTRRGGYGINLKGWGFPQPAGVLTIEGGQVTTSGGEALATNANGDYYEGGRGIIADTSVSITGGTVTTTGGKSATEKGGDGLFAPTLSISGAAATVTSTGGAAGGEGGLGLYVTNDVTIDAATVTASGGVGRSSQYGIYSPSGSVAISNGAHVKATGGNASPTGTSGGIGLRAGVNVTVTGSFLTAAGGDGLNTGASGEPGIRAVGNITFTGSELTITGGNGHVNGSHGVFSDSGDITVDSASKLSSVGGNGQTGVGGVGLRAFGGGNGMKVQLEGGSNDIYVRGGIGSAAQRESIRGKDILIGTGNIGPIVMEGGTPRSIKNKTVGDDVYLLKATTNPVAAAVVSAAITGPLAGSYTYRSPARTDGIAYLWLPAGAWTAAATGYVSQSPTVTADDAATTVLALMLPEATPTAVIDYINEQLTGLTPNASYTIGGSTLTADSDGKLPLDSGWLGQTLSIVKKGGSATSDSAAQTLSVPSRPSAPVVSADDESNTITGLALGMEYSLDGGAYVLYTGGNAPDLSGAHTVKVRTAATGASLTGEATTLTFTPNSPVPASGLTIVATDPSGYRNNGRTHISVTPSPASGNRLVYYNFRTGAVTTPFVGDTPTDYTDVPTDGLISAANGDKLGIAELDANGNVVRFGETVAVVLFTSDSDSPPPSTPTTNGGGTGSTAQPVVEVIVLVNGKAESAGKATTTESGGMKTTTIDIDPVKLQAKLDAEGDGAVVTIPVQVAANTIIGQLSGPMLQSMEKRSATLVLATDKGSYTLPAKEIGIASLAAGLGSGSDLTTVRVQITIADAPVATAQSLTSAAQRKGFQVVGSPVTFTVTVSNGAQTAEVKNFTVYVERTISLPAGLERSKITTGIVLESNGSTRHVPTQVLTAGDQYYARIQSLTNSPYAVIWHPLTFADAENHWAKDAVNDMGSRLIVNGVSATAFNPDADITRAEFAAIAVRALGLPEGEGHTAFQDVPDGAWYAGAVQTAAARGLIAGFEDGSYRPDEKITREQALAIIARAASLTGLASKTGAASPAGETETFADLGEASAWAGDSIALAAKSGLLSGRSGGRLEPQSPVTRAETATLIQRLLKLSDLI